MNQIVSSAPAASPRRGRRWLAIAALLLAVALLAGPSLLSAVAGPRADAPVGIPAGPIYTIWGTVVDSATGLPPAGAKIRVYHKDALTGEFFGIDGPDGPFITPGADGVWAADCYELIDGWLVVKLFYEPGWQSLEITGPTGSIINISEARVDLPVTPPPRGADGAKPLLGTLGEFRFTLTGPGEPTATPTPEETIPSPTFTPTPEETIPSPVPTIPTVGPSPTRINSQRLPLVFRNFVIE